MTTRHRLAALLLAFATLAGCATVPGESPVQVLRRVTDGDAAALPAGPVDGSDAGELVRGFVEASGRGVLDRGGAGPAVAPPAGPDAPVVNPGTGLKSYTLHPPQFKDGVPPPGTSSTWLSIATGARNS